MTFINDTFPFHWKSKHKQVKGKNYAGYVQIWQQFFIHKVVPYLNDFWNLFLNKVYLKDEW